MQSEGSLGTKGKVILISAICSGLLLFGLYMMARSGGGGGAEIKAEFDDVVGLTSNASVLHQGVKVGEVTGIEPVGESGESAMLTITLKADADFDIYDDAQLSLRLKTLLGELFVDLEPGTSGSELAHTVPLEQTHRDTSLDSIIFKGASLYGDVKDAEETKVIVDQVKAVIATSGDDVKAITANARVLTEGMASRAGAISAIISNLDQLTQSTDGRAGELGDAIVQVNETLAKVRDLLVQNRDQIQRLVNTINQVIETADLGAIDEALAKAPQLVEEMDRGMLIARAVLFRKMPVMGNILLLSPNGAQNAYNWAANVSQNNPVLRDSLIRMLEGFLS